MVGPEGFEPPTHGLGNLMAVLTGVEDLPLYYIRQQVTRLVITPIRLVFHPI